MDENVSKIMNIKVNRVKEACIKNNMNVVVLEHKEEVLDYLHATIQKGSSVSVGGSQTLFECNVIDELRKMDICFMDRYQEGLTREDMLDIYRNTFTCDYFLASSNAITLNGELFNVDGTGNRVAAITFGPKKVLLVVGWNKIVRDVEEAQRRVKEIAAPMNCARLNKENACVYKGECQECQSDSRICSTYVTHKKQQEKNRITIVLVKENLGY